MSRWDVIRVLSTGYLIGLTGQGAARFAEALGIGSEPVRLLIVAASLVLLLWALQDFPKSVREVVARMAPPSGDGGARDGRGSS